MEFGGGNSQNGEENLEASRAIVLSDSFYSAQSKAEYDKEGTPGSILTNNLFQRIDDSSLINQTPNQNRSNT